MGAVARFYDERKVGHVGAFGFRRSTDLSRLMPCLDKMVGEGLLALNRSRFLDLGCGDGRVNVLMSYITKISIGIEVDDWTLDDYLPLRKGLEGQLNAVHAPLPPPVVLFHGDATDEGLYDRVRKKTGVGFEDIDLFYTYLTMQHEFASIISRRAKTGAVLMVYGLERILPQHKGLRLLTENQAMEGILALYQKR